MRARMIMALLLVTAAVGPAAAQPAQDASGGVPTETQARQAAENDYNPLWDLVGLFGLAGLLGLWRSTDNDGYTDDPI